MTLAAELCSHTLERIQQRFDLREIGSPHITLTNERMPAPVGSCRLFTGGPVAKLVYIGLTVPFIQLDSHMLFAFTALDSAVPHFTLDSVFSGEHFAFHLDLIPRVDLGANLDYLNAAYQPLTDEFQAVKQIEGLSPAHLSPRQYAIMSPWMLVFRATPEAYRQLDTQVNAYLDRWFTMVEQGLPEDVVDSISDTDLPRRDELNRGLIFSRDVDPVWDQITPLVGQDASEIMRVNLAHNPIVREV